MAVTSGGGVNATTLAAALKITKSRVSQLVREGKLEGSYSGIGRDRRFDPVIAAKLLDVKLDPGQVMGNGAASADARRDLLADDPPADRRPTASARPPIGEESENARYQRARTEKAEIDALLLKRRLAEEEGRWVLASEVERAARSALAAELAQIEAMLRDSARRIADELGVEYRAVKSVLFDDLRRHRARRRDDLAGRADAAAPSEAELAEDVGQAEED